MNEHVYASSFGELDLRSEYDKYFYDCLWKVVEEKYGIRKHYPSAEVWNWGDCRIQMEGRFLVKECRMKYTTRREILASLPESIDYDPCSEALGNKKWKKAYVYRKPSGIIVEFELENGKVIFCEVSAFDRPALASVYPYCEYFAEKKMEKKYGKDWSLWED